MSRSKSVKQSSCKARASFSSITEKCGARPDSIGKRRKISCPKACRVRMRMPPGQAKLSANKRRAVVFSFEVGKRPCKSLRLSVSSSSLHTAQWLRRSVTRKDISAAAARVKVRHKIFSGFTPANNKRVTRLVRIVVLPEPAEALTHTDAAGSDAARCCSLGSLPVARRDWAACVMPSS